MPQVRTKHFATIEYEEAAVLTFPSALPGFEHLTRFLILEHPGTSPVVFFQSLEMEDVCLPALPVLTVDPDYELALATDDLEDLGFTSHEQIPGGNAIGCFAVVSAPLSGIATANLLAPVAVNLATQRAVQAVRLDNRYSHRHPLQPEAANTEGVCS